MLDSSEPGSKSGALKRGLTANHQFSMRNFASNLRLIFNSVCARGLHIFAAWTTGTVLEVSIFQRIVNQHAWNFLISVIRAMVIKLYLKRCIYRSRPTPGTPDSHSCRSRIEQKVPEHGKSDREPGGTLCIHYMKCEWY